VRKLVHVITGLGTGGAETSLYRLVRSMNGREFESHVVSLTGDGPIGARIRDLGIPVHDLGMRRARPSPLGIGRLVRLLRKTRPAILQTWLYHADLLGTLASRLVAVPVLLWNVRSSVMDMSKYGILSGLAVDACARMSGRPRAVVVNSEAGKAFHEGLGYHPKEWIVIPNGFDLEEFRPDAAARAALREELGIGPETPLVGLIARFDAMKDHATFVKAAGQIAASCDAHFVLTGAGVTPENGELAEMILRDAPKARFHRLGPRSDVPRITAALDVACSSSRGEGFSNTLGEAMACGVPCVATDVGDSARIVGEAGAVVPAGDARAFADALALLLGLGPEGRARLGTLARERIRVEYGIEAMTRRYEETYRRLAA
jgi:glycosyltransferase involved in cell wall biosynthesis